ncbi:Aminotransferase class-III [Apiospora kogelbergensis]|uniref:Aminotransferase class-III n=1 Tax=Apiospora kogelbergensis TaxID=1337665 RepID=A0AAW0Q616_9PEZI
MAHSGSLLWRNLRVYQIYGANTEVGKTIFTTTLCNATSKLYSSESTAYLKPDIVPLAGWKSIDTQQEGFGYSHIRKYARGVSVTTMHQYDLAISPHAAALGKTIPKDADLLSSIYSHLSDAARSGNPGGWFFIETAGGVHSPGPSGTSQAELYRPLRCPVLLVGDAKLGGISTTISAFESLRLRGYDIEAVLLFEDEQFRNHDYLKAYFEKKHRVRVVSAPAPPLSESQGSQEDAERMARFYNETMLSGTVKSVLEHLDERHKARVTRLESLSSEGHQRIWWPFTQQKLLSPAKITAIDSANGDFFQTLNAPRPEDFSEHRARQTPAPQEPLLQSSFDGSASWWTQGLGHANSSLTLAAAYAAGRYGHVMFAEAIHEPALALAETLLKGMSDGGNDRLSRVFYSDDGSTGVESALKMGLRAARTRYGWPADTKLGIIGLEGAYHGDTIGAMDCADPSAYNEKVEWYEGKGVWLTPPSVMCRGGRWTVKIPAEFHEAGSGMAGEMSAESLSDVFDFRTREARGEHQLYEARVERVLKHHLDKGRKFGAIMMEPVILGAGGMVLVDPLFQRALVNVVRRSQHLFSPESVQQPREKPDWTGLPVIFDEVFTGLYRLGRFTASSFLGLDADISVHAKLLTGGLVPLCATLASESIFRAFASNDKTDALLHGHSYTAHPVGCQVALESLQQMQTMESSGSWAEFQTGGSGAEDACWSIWSPQVVEWLSRRPSVAGVWALGSVMSIHLESPGGSGYTSTAAVALRDALRASNHGPAQNPWNVHSRVLGNVLYLMGSQKTGKDVVLHIERLLRQHLS